MIDELSILCAIQSTFALNSEATSMVPDLISKGYVQMVPMLTEKGEKYVDSFNSRWRTGESGKLAMKAKPERNRMGGTVSHASLPGD